MRIAARVGNLNDRLLAGDTRAECSGVYRAVDRIVGWLYVRGF